ncbi:Methionine aminopeptidase 2 [Onygenales sp. PD_40]|nr:Methionine aminopeptidase 2 [Onygenales sp. PD_40]KAK2760474.1 Methionine aminopeptidase 2 [Emmonsiellopsis sp. PD_33]KAK2789605.1 Methionine aminopeptidase 2 [Onygenales sp. PD_12]KAK2793156.1 Methionine aminopeptidase 2 [Onygenales sp. PD_10]
MGSKSPERKHPHQDGDNSHPDKPKEVPNPNTIRFADGSAGGGEANGDSDGADDDDDDLEEPQASGMTAEPADKKKKRKRRNKKKNKKKQQFAVTQSSPPRVALSTLFPAGTYPKGEFVEYNDNTARTTGEETRYLDRMTCFDDDFLKDYRQAAEVHRQVRQWSQQHIRPGQSLTSIAEEIEDGVRALTGHQGLEPGDSLKAGMGFPTGLCLNNVAAHFTPNAGATEVILGQDDVMKIDFGVHVNGRIVDSAFTMAFNPVYDNLLASVKDATDSGIKAAGIDARMRDIGAAIQEAMESYEVEIKGKTFPVKAVRNITGHDILRYKIHGGKQIPFIKNSSNQKMEEGEIFAIETFGSTGKGYLWDDKGIYGYGRNYDAPANPHLRLSSARSLLKTIDENFGTLVFCRRYLDRLGVKKYLLGMNNLVSNGIVDSYSPLSDIPGSYVAQFEHTILLHSNGKEVISRGDDY